MNMQIYSFYILILFGLWRPENWKSVNSMFFYSCLTILQLAIFYTHIASMVLDIILVAENIKEITETMIFLVTDVNAAFKMLAFILNRSKIIKLTHYFSDKYCSSHSEEELKILQKCNKRSK